MNVIRKQTCIVLTILLLMVIIGCGFLQTVATDSSSASSPAQAVPVAGPIVVSANHTFSYNRDTVDTFSAIPVALNSSVNINIEVSTDAQLSLTYTWTCSNNAITETTPTQVVWQTPSTEGIYYVQVAVSDGIYSNAYFFGPFRGYVLRTLQPLHRN